MLPTRLAIVCVSQKALKAGETAKLPRCFFDYRDMTKANAQGYSPLLRQPTDLGVASERKRKATQAQTQTEITVLLVCLIVSLFKSSN
jgi:aspartate aminotransferase-like enzyme